MGPAQGAEHRAVTSVSPTVESFRLVFARLTPVTFLSLFALVGLVLTAAAVSLATRQPWLGLALSADPESGAVTIAAAGREGANLPTEGRLLAVAGADGRSVTLDAGDLVEEPDTIATYALMRAFFARQDLLADLLAQGPVTLDIAGADGTVRQTRVAPAPRRPAADLPPPFWVQLFVGLAAYLVSIWVWSLRRDDITTRLFALTGAGMLASSYAAAIYSTRELALDGTLFRALSVVNHGGALMFGASMIALLLSYPRRLVPAGVLALPGLAAGAWWLADSFQVVFDGSPTGSHLPTVLEMAGIFAAGILQYAKTGGDPRARAVLRWFGLSVSVGAGIFVFTIIAPNLVGASPLFQQGYAFLSFLLIHLGLALGVARHRVFELDRWAFKIVFYLVGAVLLVALDAALILGVAVDRAPAFGLSLLAVAFLYLPLRDTLARRLGLRRDPDRSKWFQQVVDVALAHSPDAQNVRWRALLQEVFQPLRLEEEDSAAPQAAAPALAADGLGLAVPAAGDIRPVRLAYAYGGRKLFTPRDTGLASELHAMLAHALDSRTAYEKGAIAERGRIARDMHDNIGVQLLGALHSREPVRKDTLIRETLSDLRDIINNAAGPGVPPEEALADLRAEIADHLDAVGLGLTWEADTAEGAVLAPTALHALRSIIREAVGNVIKHANATTVHVTIRCTAAETAFTVADDGRGFDPARARPGNGLANMRARLTALGGGIDISSSTAGTRVGGRFAAPHAAARA